MIYSLCSTYVAAVVHGNGTTAPKLFQYTDGGVTFEGNDSYGQGAIVWRTERKTELILGLHFGKKSTPESVEAFPVLLGLKLALELGYKDHDIIWDLDRQDVVDKINYIQSNKEYKATGMVVDAYKGIKNIVARKEPSFSCLKLERWHTFVRVVDTIQKEARLKRVKDNIVVFTKYSTPSDFEIIAKTIRIVHPDFKFIVFKNDGSDCPEKVQKLLKKEEEKEEED